MILKKLLKKIEKTMKIKFSSFNYIVIFFISIFFAILVGNGLYGYGHDYYEAYSKNNLVWGGIFDRLGFLLATLTINNVHVGVYLNTFLLSLSTGLILLVTMYNYFNKKNIFLFLVIYLVLLHTWPIIMSTSNAMRQGLSMSFLFFALYFLIKGQKKIVFFSLLLMIFTHKSGIIFATLLIGILIYNRLFRNLSNITKRFFLFLLCVLFGVFLYFLLPMIFGNIEETRVIAGDMRIPFFLINFTFIVVYLISFRKKVNDFIDDFLLMCSISFIIFLFLGFNWQYERLNMVVIILYMIFFSKLFIKKHVPFIILFIFISLLLLTITMGMYSKALT